MTATVQTPSAASRFAPTEVHEALQKHMLVDGYRLVIDLEKSHGSWIRDARRGRDVLDFYTSFATLPLGYNHPGLHTAEFRERILPAALNKPANSDIYTTYLAEFVEAFARTLPEALRGHLFFVDGGTLAIENALKTAFDWKVRKNLAAGHGEKGHQILHFRECFHGRSGYSISMTNTADPRKTQYFPKFDWPRIDNPKLRFPATPEVLAEVEAAERAALRQIDEACDRHGVDIAALIIEPIQGEGGDNHFRAEFLQALRKKADERDFLLIFDEVQTGFGTTGKWWASEHFGVVPDIVAFGKKTQTCGIAVGPRVDEIDSVFKVSSRINSTWGGNLVDMVRCTKFIEIIEQEDLIAGAARVGTALLDGLRGLETEFPGKVTNARGRGMFCAFDLPDTETRDKSLRALNDADVLALTSGVRAIRLRPALSLTADEAAEGVRRIARALSTTLA
jgi:L-lysine 6-transaminase